MPFNDLALRLALALAIGFIVGLERGWRERDEEEGHRTAGLRTFSLIGLLGGVLGALALGGDRILLAAAFATLGITVGAFMWREGQHDKNFSVTSLIAALLTFILGAYAVLGDPRGAASAGVVAVALLANKTLLHGWVERLAWTELRAGLLLAAMTFIALPLLPDRTLDPWDSLNPHDLWLMTILIAAVSFAGYAAMKIAGPRQGLVLAAALGGLFASTAVTLSLARLAKSDGAHVKLLAGGILAAGSVMLLRVLVVTGLINRDLAIGLAPELAAAAVAMASIAGLLVRGGRRAAARDGGVLTLKNPFDLLEVLRFAAILVAVMLAVALARRHLGDTGLLGLAVLSGFADVDAMTLSVARLGDSATTSVNAILLTVAVNCLAKAVYTGISGTLRLASLVLGGTVAAMIPAAIIWARF